MGKGEMVLNGKGGDMVLNGKGGWVVLNGKGGDGIEWERGRWY